MVGATILDGNEDHANIAIGPVYKKGSDNFRSSAIRGIIKRIQNTNIKILVYEPLIEGLNNIEGVENELKSIQTIDSESETAKYLNELKSKPNSSFKTLNIEKLTVKIAG